MIRSILEVQHLYLQFAGLQVLSDVSLTITEHSIHGLIGPNGAGKTSLFNCISGLYTPTSGTIVFKQRDITKSACPSRAKFGIARTFQNLVLYDDLSVLENVMIGAQLHHSTFTVASFWSPPAMRRDEGAMRREALNALQLVGVIDAASKSVGDLPYAILKKIELARAICMRPRLLLLDEPAGGISREEVAELGRIIVKLRDVQDLSILLVEHHMGFVMQVCNSITVLHLGKKLAEGEPDDVRKDEKVIKAYLGTED